MASESSVRVVRPMIGEKPEAPTVRTASTGHQVWSAEDPGTKAPGYRVWRVR